MGENADAGEVAAPKRVLADAGGPCPTDELGRPRSLFRPGDILWVSCALRETEVTSADEFSVCVRCRGPGSRRRKPSRTGSQAWTAPH